MIRPPRVDDAGALCGIYNHYVRETIVTFGTEETLEKEMAADISLPNPASVALHEKLGFVKVGQLKEVGRKFDKWIDVGYWQKVFE